jgi:hypothetical protein
MAERAGGACIGGDGPPLLRSKEHGAEGTTGVCPICTQRFPLDAHGRVPEHPLPEDDIERHGAY